MGGGGLLHSVIPAHHAVDPAHEATAAVLVGHGRAAVVDLLLVAGALLAEAAAVAAEEEGQEDDEAGDGDTGNGAGCETTAASLCALWVGKKVKVSIFSPVLFMTQGSEESKLTGSSMCISMFVEVCYALWKQEKDFGSWICGVFLGLGHRTAGLC